MDLIDYAAAESVRELKAYYFELYNKLKHDGAYIFGTGLLGQYAYGQLSKNSYVFKGYIDNDVKKQSEEKRIYSPDHLDKNDVVIIASRYYYEISQQLNEIHVTSNIYFENLALIYGEFDTYYQGFIKLFDELERNKEHYARIRDILADDLSKEIFDLLIGYRMHLDASLLHKAKLLSIKEGKKDFDNIITQYFGKKTSFYDVGGYKGDSSLAFVAECPEYEHVYLFEPNHNLIIQSMDNLRDYSNIVFVEAGCSKNNGVLYFDSIKDGSGILSEAGEEDSKIRVVKLDDYIKGGETYIKMDIEGAEADAIAGMKFAIKKYSPMMGISVYHLPGDIHRLIEMVLKYNKNYKVYLRHYDNSYVDTVAYFVPY